MPCLITEEDAAQLLEQAQLSLGEVVHFLHPQPGHWCALFPDGESFQLEWSRQWTRLVLIADLGSPAQGREREALNLALSYNALWRQIGNLRMARDGGAGALTLIGELGPSHAEPKAFEAALVHFDGMRRWWRVALARVGDEPLEHTVSASLWAARV
ncbi:MAG: hypothetical protein GTN84_16630 [Hydrogenophaga sp.]|uniref:type III secretion system chaperone n=1 Tax=Hydrogenophaga sp. TaxID=1904254 RepID=UPI0016BD2DA0|nr:type III secretion system chaperone [Hydrogenophaga sp.]NIM42206.1 hypothetical protein [Hydrogenophaga sp.]NIN27938.1 hypothetical protein [Hydrogenophaga sp.]NIN32716.1 hypothetical protein [Hydrogenophaga sp.]NIN54605.1 hypothetical protein [Hydrogenophaga sp.]NIO51281.1 hypothetical protein [Hydrogenophaga sp.]